MNLVKYVGDRVDLEITRGVQFTQPHTLKDKNGATITTISTARVVFKLGTLLEYTTAVPGITITPSVAAGTTITWTLTKTQSRLLEAGEDYVWFLEVTYADGSIQEIFRGMVIVVEEGNDE